MHIETLHLSESEAQLVANVFTSSKAYYRDSAVICLASSNFHVAAWYGDRKCIGLWRKDLQMINSGLIYDRPRDSPDSY